MQAKGKPSSSNFIPALQDIRGATQLRKQALSTNQATPKLRYPKNLLIHSIKILFVAFLICLLVKPCHAANSKRSLSQLQEATPIRLESTKSIEADFLFDRTITSLDNPSVYLRKQFHPDRHLENFEEERAEDESQGFIDQFEEKGQLQGAIDKHTKLPIIRHYHEDSYRVDINLKIGMKYSFDLLNRIDPISMSSNFSSNINNTDLPGVQGRNQVPQLFFPDRSFHPIKIETRHKDLFILESDLRTTSFLRYEPEKGFKEIPWVIQDVLRKHPQLGCSHYYMRNKMVFFICFNTRNHKVERVDIKYDYELIILDLFLNKLLFISKFKDYHYRVPTICVNEEPLGSGNYLIFLFNKTQSKDLKAHFTPNARMSAIHMEINKSRTVFKMKNVINRDLEELIFKKISESVTFLKMNYTNSSTVDILIRRKFSDYSIKKQLFKCDIHFNPEKLSDLALENCYQSIEANIVRYAFYKEFLIYVDEHNIIHYCSPKDIENRKKLKKQGINPGKVEYDCRQGTLGLGWEFMHFEIFKKVALTLFKVDENKHLAFLFYFDTHMFTWFSYKPVKVRARHLVVVEEEGHAQLLKIHNKGISIFRLDFEQFFYLDLSHLQNLEDKILYLDGHPFYKVKMNYWDGKSVIDKFKGRTSSAIVNKTTGYYFARLGYAGNNICYSEEGDTKIYKFRKSSIDFSVTDIYYLGLKESEGSTQEEDKSTRMLFYSDYEKNFIILYKTFMMVHRFEFSLYEDQIKLKNPKRIDYSEGYELDLDRIITLDTKGDLMLFFYKDPYVLESYDFVRGQFFDFSTPDDFSDQSLKKCSLHLIIIICIFYDSESKMDVLRVYTINQSEVTPYLTANNSLLKRFEELMQLEFEGNLPQSLEVISFDTDCYKNHDIFVFIALEYSGTNRYSGFEFLISPSQDPAHKNSMDVTKWKDVTYLKHHPNVGKNSEIFYYGGVYLVKQSKPKYNLFSINRYTEMEFEYLDTNEILYQKNYPYMRIFTVIYRNLEDEQIYFAVYHISGLIETSFIRNEHFPEYNDFVAIDYVMVSPVIIMLIFYDSFTGEVLKSYTYFVRGPFILSKSFKDIIIDHDRYPLNITEEKRMHYSYYFTKQKPEILIFQDQTDKLTFRLNDYMDIKGNVTDIEWIKDPTQDNSNRKLTPVEGIVLKKTKVVKKNCALKNYLSDQKFSSNGNFFAVNNIARNTFTVYRPNSMIKVSEVEFHLPPGSNCKQVAISNRNLFCFYNMGFKSYVQILNFKNLEVAPIVTHGYSVGSNYDVIFDSDEAAFLIYLHNTKTSIEILKINKKSETSQKTILAASDFSEHSMFISGLTFFYNRKDKNLVVMSLNIITNNLIFYSGFFDEQTLNLNGIRTIKNKVNMNGIAKNLMDLKCSDQMKNYVFDCLLIGKDNMLEVRISKDFNAEISPFKWDIKVLHIYFNILFNQHIEQKTRIQYRISDDNLFLVLYNSTFDGIVVYKRFQSQYIHGYFEFKADESGINRPLTSVISSDGKKIQILGLDKTDNDFMVSIYKAKVIKFKIKPANLFIDTTQTIRFTFWSQRQIEVNFKFANASDLEEEKNRWSMLLLLGLKGLLVFTSLAICLALICLFKLLKDGGHGVLEHQKDYQTQQTILETEHYSKMYTRKRTAYEQGNEDSLSADGNSFDPTEPEELARLRFNLEQMERTKKVRSNRIGNVFSGRTLRPADL